MAIHISLTLGNELPSSKTLAGRALTDEDANADANANADAAAAGYTKQGDGNNYVKVDDRPQVGGSHKYWQAF